MTDLPKSSRTRRIALTPPARDALLATKHWCVHHLFCELGLSPRAIAEQMGWSLAGTLKLLAVYGHTDVGALDEVDRAFGANVTPLRVAG